MAEDWLTIDVERALYVQRGRDVILCDRLPSPVTLVVKVTDDQREYLQALLDGMKYDPETRIR